MAAQWAAMVDDGHFTQAAKGGAERVLTQDEIDLLLGFSLTDVSLNDNSGIRAIINSAMVSYERLPMLEIVFDRLVRLMTTSLRNFTSDNVEVSLDRITSVRFGDYLNSIPLPAILGVFKAEEWDNSGLITINSSLIYSIIDVLLGGRRGQTTIRIEGRPYTTIETNLIKRMIEVVLADAELAFRPLSPVEFNIDRLETNPRFAAISRPANAAILVRLRIDMEDRGGTIELLLPYATIEPIRDVLLQMFMGEKFGRDPTWEGHLATEKARPKSQSMRYFMRRVAVKADHEARRRRHLDAGTEIRRAGQRALRRYSADRGAHGPGRRPRRGAGGQTPTQTEHDVCDVRNGRRHRRPHGDTMSNSFGVDHRTPRRNFAHGDHGLLHVAQSAAEALKADEHSLRATISELVTATEIAERAIAGLKIAVRECDVGLGQRLSRAEAITADFDRGLTSSKDVLHRLSQIVAAGRAPHEPAPRRRNPRRRPVPVPVPVAARHDAQAVSLAAQAVSERLRIRCTV